MTLPFPRLSCSVLLFLRIPCPQMIILYCLRRSNIRCIDDLTMALQYRPCSCRLGFSVHRFLCMPCPQMIINSLSSYNSSSCLIIFDSMTLPFPRLSFLSFFFFACLCRPRMAILNWLSRYNIYGVDDLAITLQ